MTPKEKAKELCRRMLYQIEWNAQPSTVKGVAKQCALIAVDELIKDAKDAEDINYWQEVKQEIEKL
jgi:hypothetical protein